MDIEVFKKALREALIRNEDTARDYQEQASFCTDPAYKQELLGRVAGLVEANANIRRAMIEIAK
jgi:hypothetical protein